MGGRSGPDIGSAGFPAAVDVPLIGRWLEQDNRGEFVERVFFEAAAKSEAAGVRKRVEEKHQIRLDVMAVAERGFGIVGGDHIAVVIVQESRECFAFSRRYIHKQDGRVHASLAIYPREEWDGHHSLRKNRFWVDWSCSRSPIPVLRGPLPLLPGDEKGRGGWRVGLCF